MKIRDLIAACFIFTMPVYSLPTDFLDHHPDRKIQEECIAEVMNYEARSLPKDLGSGRFLYIRTLPHEESNSLCLQTNQDVSVLISPESFDTDPTARILNFWVSPNKRYLVFSLITKGSDWETLRIYDLKKGCVQSEVLTDIKFAELDWSHDSRGFYYNQFFRPNNGRDYTGPTTHFNHCFHKVGTSQNSDKVIGKYSGPAYASIRHLASLKRNQEHLISIDGLYGKKIYQVGIGKTPRPVLASDSTYVGSDQDLHYFITKNQAPRGRLVSYQGEREETVEVLPEDGQLVLADALFVKGKIVTVYQKDACQIIKIFNATGKCEKVIDFKEPGTFANPKLEEKLEPSADGNAFYFSFSNFLKPPSIYKYSFKSLQHSLVFQPDLSWDPSEYRIDQQFYLSKDGTAVPMFIVTKKSTPISSENPLLLYGYGGFNVSLTPFFNPNYFAWIKQGGVFAVANIRGGGEYGEAWHQAGMKEKKQNTFDDFIAAADWLVDNGYTNSQKLAITGRSNGGLLVGACLTQRPELFRAAIPCVGVYNMVEFPNYTVGKFWEKEYGSPTQPHELNTLLSYSPCHQVKANTSYPGVFLITADHDDRVVPLHTFQFAQELQQANTSDLPILLKVYENAGHRVPLKTQSQQIEEYVDQLIFLNHMLGRNTDA